ncbi:MAG: Trk system potassium transporter TrkA [Sphingobacteriia bacterium]|nr:Trk system potassium transporter TrkA [Sphingobacteriia bacterium]
MKVIICGAGLVGYSIALHLAKERHDVTIIDTNHEVVNRINNSHDIRAIHGFASHPNVLKEAGAENADAIIAVTVSDEVNFVICQIAYAIFHIPLKIARIRQQSYLRKEWSSIYETGNLNVDVLISPEHEVAKAIYDHLEVPGVENIISFCEDKIKVLILEVKDSYPILKQEIIDSFNSNKYKIFGLLRNEEYIFDEEIKYIQAKDKLCIAIASDEIEKICELSGLISRKKNIIIIGGGNIGHSVASLLEQDDSRHNVKLIELSEKRANYIAEDLQKTIIINGNAIDKNILEEVEVTESDKVLVLTNDDKVNILASLLAKSAGCREVITLINDYDSYADLVSSLGIDLIINPRDITINSIIRHFNYDNITSIQMLGTKDVEIIEVEVADNSFAAFKPINQIDSTHIALAAILRENNVIIPSADTEFLPFDKVVMMVKSSFINSIKDLFSVNLEV